MSTKVRNMATDKREEERFLTSKEEGEISDKLREKNFY